MGGWMEWSDPGVFLLLTLTLHVGPAFQPCSPSFRIATGTLYLVVAFLQALDYGASFLFLPMFSVP